jgi:hypothetical protein
MIVVDQRIILGSLAILFVLVIMFMYFGHSNLKSIGQKQITTDNTLKRLAETVLAMKHERECEDVYSECCESVSESVSSSEPVILNEPEYVDSDSEEEVEPEPVVIVTPVKPVKQTKRKSKKVVEELSVSDGEAQVVSD